MVLKPNKGKILPIGIDLGSTMVKMAQLRQIEGGFELIAAAFAEIPQQNRQDAEQRMTFLRHAVRTLARSNDFKSRECILSLPAAITFLQHVKLPKLPPEEISKALKWELQGKLPFAVEDAVIRHVVAGEVYGEEETKQEVIVAAASAKAVEQYLTLAQYARLEVVGLNIEPCAIVECFGRLFEQRSDSNHTILYVDLGAASTQVVLSHGSRMVFAKNLPAGGTQMDRAVANGLNISVDQAHAIRRNLANTEQTTAAEDELYRLLNKPMDDLAQELTLCLRYDDSIFRGHGVERAIFVGGQAYDKRLCQAIAKRLNLPAQVGDPLLHIRRAPNVTLGSNQPRPDWAVAVGLGIGAARAA